MQEIKLIQEATNNNKINVLHCQLQILKLSKTTQGWRGGGERERERTTTFQVRNNL